MLLLRYIFLLLLTFTLSGCFGRFPLLGNSYTTAHLTKASEYNVRLGLAYLQEGDKQRAKEKLLKAHEQNPYSPIVKSALAYFFEDIEEWKQAENYHLQAIKFNKDTGTVHNNYGRFLCQRNRYSEAESHFLIAAQDPNYINTASAYENAGLCMMQASNTEKAISYLYKSLQQNPQLEKASLGLAQLYFQEKEYMEAYTYWQQYKQLSIQHTPAALAFGIQLTLALEKEEEAKRYALLLQSQYPESSQYKTLLESHPALIRPKPSLYY